MTKKTNLLWWVILIIVAVGVWYLWKANQSAGPISNNVSNTVTPGGSLPMGSGKLDSAIAGIIQESAQEQAATIADAGEDALAKSVSQQVGDLSQIYDENTY